MPAPPTAIVDAFRNGTAAGHWFFELDHSSGPVRVWDGVGSFTFLGNTFTGVGGFISHQGLGAGSELQNHEVIIALNAVSNTSLTNVDFNIRDKLAKIWKVVIAEDYSVIGYRLIFQGLGDNLRIKPGVDNSIIYAKLRAPLADWASAPSMFYTLNDQQRLFAGDTGFSEVAGLENGSVSGWAKDPETAGAVPVLTGGTVVRNSITGAVIGSATLGLSTKLVGTLPPIPLYDASGAVNHYYGENGTSAVVGAASSSGTLQIGGVDCYVDVAGDVRTAAALTVWVPALGSTSKLRQQTAITANGTATATQVAIFTSQGARAAKIGSGYTLTSADQTALVYDNLTGQPAINSSGLKVNGNTFVEDVTGTGVAISGFGDLTISGSPISVSTTGVLLSAAGRRVVRSGGAATEFLRVWS